MEAAATVDQKPDYLDGLQFKAREMDFSRIVHGPLAAIRVDGRAFSQLTRKQGYALPYDLNFMAAMDAVARDLLKLVDGSIFAYAQSDEVSVIFGPTGSETDPNWWFGGKLQKLASLSAARASLSFLQAELERTGEASMDPLFDARVLELDGPENAWEYLRWRRYDAQKNSITMAAQTLRSHSELHGVSSYERRALLEGTELEQLPDGFFNGRLHYRTRRVEKSYDRKGKLSMRVPLIPTSAPATKEFIEKAIPALMENRYYGTTVVELSEGAGSTAQ